MGKKVAQVAGCQQRQWSETYCWAAVSHAGRSLLPASSTPRTAISTPPVRKHRFAAVTYRQNISTMGSDSNPSSPQSSATPLKSKKSLDWLAKSFKRKGSTSSTSSNSSDHRRSGLVGNSRNIHNHEPLLTIPGSPAITQPLYSPATSSDDGDARSSRSDLGPFTPDEAIPGHLVLPQTRPIHSPLASPSILPASPVSPGSPPTMSLKAPQPLSPGRIGTLSPSKICEESRSISLSNVPSRSSTPGRDLQSQIDKDSPGREKEKLLTSVSSRKALRTMLDEWVKSIVRSPVTANYGASALLVCGS